MLLGHKSTMVALQKHSGTSTVLQSHAAEPRHTLSKLCSMAFCHSLQVKTTHEYGAGGAATHGQDGASALARILRVSLTSVLNSDPPPPSPIYCGLSASCHCQPCSSACCVLRCWAIDRRWSSPSRITLAFQQYVKYQSRTTARMSVTNDVGREGG